MFTRLRFESVEGSFEDAQTRPSEVYAVLARPVSRTEHKLPGVLVCHGGGGKADEQVVAGWARQGFVALAPELPGWAAEQEINGLTRFKGKPYGTNRFAVTPAVQSCAVFDSIVAALGAFNLLETLAEVDATRLGITGISWGAYLTTLLCGYLDQRVKVAFALYGSGCYDAGTVFQEELNRLPEHERALWLRHYDAGKHADRITATFLLYAATNDSFFYPPAIAATLNRMQTARASVSFAPNCDHRFDLSGGTGQQTAGNSTYTTTEPAFFRHILHEEGGRLPKIVRITARAQTREHEIVYSFLPEQTHCQAYYTTNLAKPWKNRSWQPLELVRQEGSSCRFRMPDTSQTYNWFGVMTYPLTPTAPLNIGTLIQHS